eukprot:TRINITY_DN7533_c0_g1_i1.p1 TRINITY_DN7533_c0_g1~~TRINITY_DN7533_c0_g1_i1.p1  ORF type:complete len:170 (+),score=37.36 TRINITY_DN7533_c0_g1_i1:18-527(+)
MSISSVEHSFIENVSAYMDGKNVEEVLNNLQTQYRNYKYLEEKLHTQRTMTKAKIPEMQRALDSVLFLKKLNEDQKSVTTQFEVNPHVWANAEIPAETDSVILRLGANVMVEYPIDEAIELLTDNIEKGKQTLDKFQLDLETLKDQITITEVNMARIFNYDVRSRTKKQ